MSIDTLAVSLIVDPVTIIDVTVRMNESAATVGFAVLPPAFIHGTVRPNLLAFTFSNNGINDPLTDKLGLVIKILHRSLLEILAAGVGHRRIVQVIEIAELLVNFLK